MAHRFTWLLSRAGLWLQVAMLVVLAALVGSLLASSLAMNRVARAVSHRLVAENRQAIACESFIGTADDSLRLAQWQAACYLKRGDVEAALPLLQDLLRRDPGNVMLYPLVSQAYEGNDRLEAFLDLLDLWRSLGTSGGGLQREGAAVQLLRVGQKAQRAGKRHDALLALRAAWKLAPEDPDIPYYLTYAERDVDDWLAALYPLWQAIRANPDHTVLQMELKKLVDVKQVEAEIERLQSQVEAMPGDADAHLRLGWALFMAGKPLNEALRETGQGIDLAPHNPNGYVQMGDLLRCSGREKEAVSWYERGLQVAPWPPISAVAGLGIAWYYVGDYDMAAQWLTKAVSRDPARRGLWDMLAASYRYSGQCAPAIAAAQRTMSLSGNLNHDLSLAQLYESCGLIREAIGAYEGILMTDPQQRLQHELAQEALHRLQQRR